MKYAIERDHLPLAYGCLHFDTLQRRFDPPAPTPTLEAQATAYVESYLRKI